MGIGGGTQSEDYSADLTLQEQESTSIGAEDSFIATEGGLAAEYVNRADIDTNITPFDVRVTGGKYATSILKNIADGAAYLEGNHLHNSDMQINMLDGNAIERAFLFASESAAQQTNSVDSMLSASQANIDTMSDNVDKFAGAYESIYEAAYESARLDKSALSPYMPVLVLGSGMAALLMYYKFKKGKK